MQAADYGRTSSASYIDVQDHEVRFALHGQVEAGHPIRCSEHLIARKVQGLFDGLKDILIIINDKYSLNSWR